MSHERKKSKIKNYAQIYKNIKNKINSDNKKIVYDNNISYTIEDKWIKAKGLNCRFSTFFTIFYFIFREYIDSLEEEDEYRDLKELNILILKLVDDYNDNNYFNIIKFLQTKQYDSNNKKLDKLLTESNLIKHNDFLEKFKTSQNIDYFSSGYISQLLRVFNNKKNFCIIEKKREECIICNKKT